MRQVNVHEAKTQLSRLLEEVERGEEITIARHGKPVAVLSKVPAAQHSGFGSVPEFAEWTPQRMAELDAELLRDAEREEKEEHAQLMRNLDGAA
ncbi:MAG: type II toxin-antitoxin system prevent-host-death family antitoxin [Patulibacter sp.]